VVAIALAAFPAFGQRLSFGVAGGTGLSRDFRTQRYTFPWEGASYTEVSESRTRSLVIGPMAELGLTGNWSVEVNALHRALRYSVRSDFPGTVCGVNTFCGGDLPTWQFPVLVKYRIPLRPVKPFATLGPSFRTHGTPLGAQPSSFGITAGLGVELNAGPFYFAPTVRYTRWGADNLPFRPTVRDQVEVLGGIGYRTDSGTRRPFGRKVWLGLVAGVPVTNDFPPESTDTPEYTGVPRRTADFRSVAGLLAEVEVTSNLSLELNGLYRRLHFETGPEVVVTWQIPVLAKYNFGRRPLRPFVEAGPSFRLTGNLNNADPGHYGITGGAGAEARFRRLRVTPALRYTRWTADQRAFVSPQAFTKRNQVELLAGISF
jgi:hypothetical protein